MNKNSKLSLKKRENTHQRTTRTSSSTSNRRCSRNYSKSHVVGYNWISSLIVEATTRSYLSWRIPCWCISKLSLISGRVILFKQVSESPGSQGFGIESQQNSFYIYQLYRSMMDGNDKSLWDPNLIFGLIRLRSYMGNLEIVHKKFH